MELTPEMTKLIGIALAFVIVPLCRMGHRKAHERAKERMSPGLLKWLCTHEFGKRQSAKP